MVEREMHKAVCSECSHEYEVLFKADLNRPVYCRECCGKNNRIGENHIDDSKHEQRIVELR